MANATVKTGEVVKASTQAANLIRTAGVIRAKGPSKVKVGKNTHAKGTPAWETFRVTSAQARVDARSEWIGAQVDALSAARSLVDSDTQSTRWSITAGGVTRSLVGVLDAMEGTSLQADAAFSFAASIEPTDGE